MKITMFEIINALDGIKDTLDMSEEKTRVLEYVAVETIKIGKYFLKEKERTEH